MTDKQIILIQELLTKHYVELFFNSEVPIDEVFDGYELKGMIEEITKAVAKQVYEVLEQIDGANRLYSLTYLETVVTEEVERGLLDYLYNMEYVIQF